MCEEPSKKRRRRVYIVDPDHHQLLKSADTDSASTTNQSDRKTFRMGNSAAADFSIQNSEDADVEDAGIQILSNPENILTVSPEIITSILNNFSSRDVHLLSRVCRNWRFYSKKILRQRQCVRSFFFVKKRNMAWQAIGEAKQVQEFFKELDIDPRLIVIFGKLPLSRPCMGGSDFRNLRSLLPAQCCMIGGLTFEGIMGIDPQSRQIVDLQHPKNDCFSCLVFPEMKGIKIFTFHLTLDRCIRELSQNHVTHHGQDNVGVAEDIVGNVLNADDIDFRHLANLDFEGLFNIPSDQRVKCLILLSTSFYPVDLIQQIFSIFYKRENGRIAMAGGRCCDTLASMPDLQDLTEFGLIGIAFCGDDSIVEARSCVIPADVKSRSAIRRCLTNKLARCGNTPAEPDRTGKNRVPTVKSSYGFIFTCTGRGKHIFRNKAGVESNLILEQFPKTSFVGCFALGECGVDFVGAPDCRKICVEKDWVDSNGELKVPDVTFTYSTAVAIVNILS